MSAEPNAGEQNTVKVPRRRVDYKLHYFNVKGRGEMIRLILAYAKAPYEDIRYTPEEWAAKKADMPFGQIPVLEWRGQLLPQSAAIVRFLAKRHGLLGSDEWQAAKIDAYLELINETLEAMRPVFAARGDDEKMKEAMGNYMKNSFEPMSDRLEKQLAENDTGFVVGNQLSAADLAVFCFYDLVSSFAGPDSVPKTKHIPALCARVQELPAIKAWLEKRPKTPY